MLVHDPMFRGSLAIIVITALGTAASAGVYLGLGVGPAANTGNDTSGKNAFTSDGNGRSARFILGARFGRFSLEGDVDHYGVLVDKAYPFDAWDAALLLKYSYPLSYGFEVFGKGGLVHTWLTNGSGDSTTLNSNGNGWVLGAGLEWRFNLVLAGCSLFVDYEFNSSSFSYDATPQDYNATAGMWMLGATVSI